MTKNELTNILKEIWDEKDFITGVQLCLSNDKERQMLAADVSGCYYSRNHQKRRRYCPIRLLYQEKDSIRTAG